MTSFILFSGASLYFLLALLFARYSPFYLCLSLFSFEFFLPYSAYFGVLSNFLVRFSRLALRLSRLAFFGPSVSFFPAYFHSKHSLHVLELQKFLPVDKALALPVLLLCELMKNCEIIRTTVQLQPHQFDFPLKTWVANYMLRDFTSTSPREALL